MSHSLQDNVVDYPDKQTSVVFLLVDEETHVAIADRPIFGNHVTIDSKLLNCRDKVLPAGTVLGWLDYVSINKFGCVNQENHYVDASNYFDTYQNTLRLIYPATLIKIDEHMQKSKRLLQFKFSNADLKKSA